MLLSLLIILLFGDIYISMISHLLSIDEGLNKNILQFGQSISFLPVNKCAKTLNTPPCETSTGYPYSESKAFLVPSIMRFSKSRYSSQSGGRLSLVRKDNALL